MRLQDLFTHYDAVPLGMDGIYSTVGTDSFHINSTCVKAISHTITTGHTYLLKWSDGNVQEVLLIDAFHDNTNINLLLRDIRAEKVLIIKTILDGKEHQCPWTLIDVDYMQEQVDELIAKAYCESR
jgi:hypothetical protein